jgi:hypothetical protein
MKPARQPDPPVPNRQFSPETMAKRAVSRKPLTPSGHRVKFAVTLFLPHEVAEYVIARALREGKSVAGLVGEILAAESRRT